MLTGFLLDSRKNIGPKGKFRPFILYAAVPAALIATLQFIATTFSLPVKTTIATALFMMFGLSYSLMNCSYGAMIPAITKNPNERAQLAAYRQGGATIGLLICTVAFIPLQSLFLTQPSVMPVRHWCSPLVALFLWCCATEASKSIMWTQHQPDIKPVFSNLLRDISESAIAGFMHC